MQKLSIGIYYIRDIVLNLFSHERVVLISEPATWSIYEDCKNIKRFLTGIVPIRIAFTATGLRNKIIHFASVGTLVKEHGMKFVHPSNTVVLTWFHLNENDGARLQQMKAISERIAVMHTSCAITKSQLIEQGMPEDKIVVIPIGVDAESFRPPHEGEKERIRAELGIPEGKVIIGSFQKDGNGWGEGLSPKMVKGPDVFCSVVEAIAKRYPIHVLLTGPARGYVRRRLDAAGIPYTHRETSIDKIPSYYRALDLYLGTSRAEGGPKAILEASASGIPVVSTKVGMVPDIMTDGKDCLMADIEDVPALTAKTESLISDPDKRSLIARNAIETAQAYDIRHTVRMYYDKIYKHFLA
jgi:glycosyltransferase involved in cell wall biosynthesis